MSAISTVRSPTSSKIQNNSQGFNLTLSSKNVSNLDIPPPVSIPSYANTKTKYIIITGGSMSGVGKGMTICALGSLLKIVGFRLTAIKIDPYLNVDAGTMSPYEHGEVYVLADGGEVDLDLGNYERAFGATLTRAHNITTGQVYGYVLSEERRGTYLGKTVQVVPHVTDAIQQFIYQTSQVPIDDIYGPPDICLIEIGGTVGDIESAIYLEAMQQFQSVIGRENFLSCHVAHIPVIGSMNEQKTKPTQHSTKELFKAGLRPDFALCRCTHPLIHSTKKKVSTLCQVPLENVISVHDVKDLNELPLIMAKQNLIELLCKTLNINPNPNLYIKENKLLRLKGLDILVKRKKKCLKGITIGVVGKYTGLTDTYYSIIKSLEHAALEALLDLKIKWINSTLLENIRSCDYDNIIKSHNFKRKRRSYNLNDVSNQENFQLSFNLNISDDKFKDSYEKSTEQQEEAQSTTPIDITTTNLTSPQSSHFISTKVQFGDNDSISDFQLQHINFVSEFPTTDFNYKNKDSSFESPSSPSPNLQSSSLSILSINDSQMSISGHSQLLQDCLDAWKDLEDCDGIICPGGFGDRGIVGKGLASRYCMDIEKPYLGICLGMQTALIDFAQHRLGMESANSVEFDANTPYPVIISMPEHVDGLMGGTMRLGSRSSTFSNKDCLSYKLYDKQDTIYERHRHRYEVNPLYINHFEQHGFHFVAKDHSQQRMEIAEYLNHPFFIAVQFHPEFTSRPFKPSPLFLGLLLACTGQLTKRLEDNNGSLLSGQELLDL